MFNKITNFNCISCISSPHKLIKRASDTALSNGYIKKLAIFSIHGKAAYKVPYPFYLVDILFLQLTNISILLHTFIVIDFEIKFSLFILESSHMALGPL